MYSVAIVVCLFVLLAAGYSISGYNRHYISKRNGYCNSKSSVGTLHASSRSKSKSAAIIDYDASQVGYGYDISESFEEISSLNPIPQFLKAVESSLYSDTSGYSFIKIVLSDNKRISDDESSVKDIKLITGRLIQLKKGLHLQLTYKYLTNDQMKNYSVDDIPSIVGDIEKYVKNGFKRAVLSTKKNVYELNMKRGMTIRLHTIDLTYLLTYLLTHLQMQAAENLDIIHLSIIKQTLLPLLIIMIFHHQ